MIIDERIVSRAGSDAVSRAITLPKDWCDFWNIKAGSKITIVANKIAIIIPDIPNKAELIAKAKEIVI